MTDTSLNGFERGNRRSRRRWDGLPDQIIALFLLPAVLVVLAILYPIALVVQGRPFLYASDRMASSERCFRLWKVRTMVSAPSAECAVLGGHLAPSVTRFGTVLRRFRLDELPQIFNILAGDMRFIGPRPPLPKYVEAYPDLYAQVLKSPPGITGLATVLLHRREARILSRCMSAKAADEAYRRHCIPRKARLDLIYQRRRNLWLDMYILVRTVSGLFGASVGRRRRA